MTAKLTIFYFNKVDMFNIVQQLVPNCCSVVVVVAHMVLEQHKELELEQRKELEPHKVLEQQVAGTKFERI